MADSTPDDEDAALEDDRLRESIAASHVALSACTAAIVAGLFALTQLSPMADWGTTIATYAFAVGLPVSAAATWESSGEPDYSQRLDDILTVLLLISASAALVGLTGLFAHFHVAAAACFVVAAIAAVMVFYFALD